MLRPVSDQSARSRGEQSLRIRRFLMAQLRQLIGARGFNQVEAARWLQIGQPRISQLLSGQTNRFSTDTLLDLLEAAGYSVKLELLRREPLQSGPMTRLTEHGDSPAQEA